MSVGKSIVDEARDQKQLKNEYRSLFLGTPLGKTVLTDMLQYCGVLHPVHVKGDAEQTAINEGKRMVGLTLIDLIDQRGYDDILALERHGLTLTQTGEEYEDD